MSAPRPTTMYVTTDLCGGGAERLLTTLLLQEDARDTISVVSLLPGGVFRRTLEDAGIKVTDLGVRSVAGVVHATFALAALIRSQRPAVVYGWMYHGNLLAMAARLIAGQPRAPLFWSVFTTDSVGPRICLRSRVVRRISALLSRWVTGVIYNAAEARDFHRRIGFREQRSVVLSNVIDAKVFRRDQEQREAFRASLAIGADVVVVGVVGRVAAMKDWRTVQLAVRDLSGVVTVAIGVGTSELPPQDGFIGLGWRDDVVSLLSASDIFLLGSAFGEGTSLALGEAMLCGLPCVVTAVGGNGALAGDGGIVVEPNNPAAIREALLRLVGDRATREEIGRTARVRALAAVSGDDTFRRLHDYSIGGVN